MNSFETEDRTNPFSQYDNAGQTTFPQFSKTPTQDNIRERIEASKSNGWGAQIAKLARSQKKKLLIFAAMALIFMGGSYLSNRNNTDNVPPLGNEDLPGSAINLSSSEDAATSGKNDVPLNVLDIKINEDGEVIFSDEENEGDEGSITKTASRGDGITHLARSAIKDYLAESGKTLSAEQKIYAEDYAQNKIGSESLEVGQKISFSKDLLGEAVRNAEALEQWQLENLKQYTSQVSLL
ncbi:MAG: hypothetical protein WAP23_03695 [Candidatus Spechtbacterales bacterium]